MLFGNDINFDEVAGTLSNNSDDMIWNSLVDELYKRGIKGLFVTNLRETETGEKLRGLWANTRSQEYILIDIDYTQDEITETLAHELGHSMLHKEIGFTALNKNGTEASNRIEFEANLFAAVYIESYKQNITRDLDLIADIVKGFNC